MNEFIKLLKQIKSNDSLVESLEVGYSLCFEAVDGKSSINMLDSEFAIDSIEQSGNEITLTLKSRDDAVLSLDSKSANFNEFVIESVKELQNEFGDSFNYDDYIELTLTTSTQVTGTEWFGGSRGSYWEQEEAAGFEDVDLNTEIIGVQITVTFNGDERTFEMNEPLIFNDQNDVSVIITSIENYLNASGKIEEILSEQTKQYQEEQKYDRDMSRDD
jgi:hypothetical protein